MAWTINRDMTNPVQAMNIEEQSLQVLSAASDSLTAQLAYERPRRRVDSITDWEEKHSLPTVIKRDKVKVKRRGCSQPRPRPILRREPFIVFDPVLRRRNFVASQCQSPTPILLFQEPAAPLSPQFPRRRAGLKLSLKLPEMKASKADITFAKLDLTSPYNEARRKFSVSPQKQSYGKR